MFKKYIFLILVVFFALFSCKRHSETDPSIIPDTLDTIDVFDSIIKVYYSLPSPLEIATITKKYSVEFDTELLHPTSEAINYTTTEAQAVNLGIYSSDLAFVSLYDQKQYASPIFTTLIKLADKIEILEGINDTLLTNIENNLDNPDEIKHIIADAFFRSDAYLKENGKELIATYIMTGAWVESFYIMSDMAVNSTDTTNIYQLIIDQRLVLDNIISTINLQDIDDSTITSLEELLTELNNCITIEKKEVLDPYTDSLRTKTIVNYNYSTKKIKEIYEKIRNIRENFVSLH